MGCGWNRKRRELLFRLELRNKDTIAMAASIIAIVADRQNRLSANRVPGARWDFGGDYVSQHGGPHLTSRTIWKSLHDATFNELLNDQQHHPILIKYRIDTMPKEESKYTRLLSIF